jgi:hypothetical protein
MVASALLVAAGCGSDTGGTGTLVVQLVDAPSPDVKGIVVTIDTVTAHSDQGGWVTVAHGPITVDLLTLQDVAMKLGEVTLPAGTVSESGCSCWTPDHSTWCSRTTPMPR